MGIKKKNELFKFFNISFAVSAILYIIFYVILLFSISVTTDIIACLSIGFFLMVIMRNTVNEKFNELKDVADNRILSFHSFSLVTVCCCAVSGYCLRIEQRDTMLWSLLALYVSVPLDQSVRALRRLKQK